MKTMNRQVVLTDPQEVRASANDPNFTSAELFKAEANGHKFAPGETRWLTGLVDYAEYNGQPVKITGRDKQGAKLGVRIPPRMNIVRTYAYAFIVMVGGIPQLRPWPAGASKPTR